MGVCTCVYMGCVCSGSDNLGSGQLVPESSGSHVWLVCLLLWLRATFRPETIGGHPS